jgi:hypothetical protein
VGHALCQNNFYFWITITGEVGQIWLNCLHFKDHKSEDIFVTTLHLSLIKDDS